MKIEARNANAYINHMKTLAYLGNVEEWDVRELYAKLRRIEMKANRWMVDECNYPDVEHDTDKVLAKVQKLLPLATGLFINGDPRGYTLKIKGENVNILNENGNINIYRDWGGYGIVAPEF